MIDALVSAPGIFGVWIALLRGLRHKLSCLGAEPEASLSLSPFSFDPPGIAVNIGDDSHCRDHPPTSPSGGQRRAWERGHEALEVGGPSARKL